MNVIKHFIAGEPTFDVPSGVVVLVVAAGLILAAVVRLAFGRAVRVDQMAARLVGVGVAAWLARAASPWGLPLWDLDVGEQVAQPHDPADAPVSAWNAKMFTLEWFRLGPPRKAMLLIEPAPRKPRVFFSNVVSTVRSTSVPVARS